MKTLIAFIIALVSFAGLAEAQSENDPLFVVLTSNDAETQMMAMVLATQSINKDVPVYSETEMYGFRTEKHKPDIRTWFSQGDQGIYSTLFFSFQNEATVKSILEEVAKYNEEYEGDRDNPLHAYQVAVEDFA